MDSDAVVKRFGLGADVRAWLEEAERLPEPVRALEVPVGERAARVLDLFGLAEADRAEVEASWPGSGSAGGEWPPELWHLVGCMYRRLCADADLPVGVWRDWPTLVGAEDPRVRAASLWAFAARVEAQFEAHGALGVDPSVTAATLADVGVQVARSRRMFGRLSVETAAWVAAQFRGRLFWVGGLQLEPALLGRQGDVEWYGPEEEAGLEPGMRSGEAALRLHIPSGGLDPVGVEESLGRARGFARAHLGCDPVVATCTSWLLDPRWREVLGEGSNIVRFQRRFTLVGEGRPGEGDVFRFVFGMPVVDVGAAPRRTRLERAVVERLESGGGWQVRTGWLRLSG
ncbi:MULTISPECIES: acyltransferase domain-containing protein [unclassified Nocardiopsis]|uniref:acyltransferase domain-containing protein n=1 Tax=unclassified Nocardiopsis TaxID=2649073 RepID=UPI001357C80E|nr:MULTISPECIES: acyltransferase domain-containing protein [unclassified Nocardiopsis]